MMSVSRQQQGTPLSSLLADLVSIDSVSDLPITGVAQDSRLVDRGFLFLACSGLNQHGMNHLQQAIEAGAVALVCEPGGDWGLDRIRALGAQLPLPLLVLEGLSQQVSLIAGRFFGHPSQRLKLIGFTGTNGKTSCSQFLAQVLQDRRCAVIGTLGSGFPGQLEPTTHTTPDAVGLQARIRALRNLQARVIAMEVSSHALDQGRVNALDFDTAVLTNLSRDHLDYHGDMDSYRLAKQRLFDLPGLRSLVLNYDDAFGRDLIHQFRDERRVVTYGLETPSSLPSQVDAWVWGRHLQAGPEGMCIQLHSSWGDHELVTPLLGRFNASNLLAVLSVLLEQGMALSEAVARLTRVRGVAGRMERFGALHQPSVVVDYAHTPDALQQTLRALREHCRGRLLCVFGCGGDRDQGKRPLMGEIAERLADQVILTDDNPRSENGGRIIEQILAGVARPERIEVEPNRARAIRRAIALAGREDLVLVAGKGHETRQQVGDLKLPFSDREQVEQALQEQVRFDA